MKKKVFIAINSMIFGGVQKSLLSFLEYIKDKAEIDILVWHDDFELELPSYVNIIDIPKVFSIKTVVKENGIFNKHFLVSVLGRFLKHSWNAMPKLKRKYDIAICYTHVRNIKYFVIDNVKADKKYAFYHHGSYEFNGAIKSLDAEYYPKYDKVFAVSNFAKEVLLKEFGDTFEIEVCPNLINIDEIKFLAEEPCVVMDEFKGLKLLTVGRLSDEKNPLALVDIAKHLVDKKIDFKWFVVGDGILFNDLKAKINSENLDGHFVLMGGQSNPYKFMKRCDAYVQFSKFEADPIVIKEVAVFNKPMFLSVIPSFIYCKSVIPNIETFLQIDDLANAFANIKNIEIIEFSISNLNNQTKKLFDKILGE